MFVCHHDLAGRGSAIFLPIKNVFLELILTGQLINQPQPPVTLEDAGQSIEIRRTSLSATALSLYMQPAFTRQEQSKPS